ncbi:hypothetical protein [Rubrivirga sp.]|uniref:hypothetical protein n=1 Tax=Rubrivirga sp. TaxID=1885344 RepID=UPI003C74793F
MTRLLTLTLLLAATASAQGVPLDPDPPSRTETDEPAPTPRPVVVSQPSPAPVVAKARIVGPRRLGGPRTGVTILSAGTVDRINEQFGGCLRDDCPDDALIDNTLPIVTQFGWQFENRIFQSSEGLTGVTEWVVLVGGAERGLFLPSLTFLAGLRMPSGLEVGVGPNLSLGGAAYAAAIGFNNEVGEINIPFNLAVVFGDGGPRASVLVGFNVSGRRW